jgi:hypothetical protein
MADASVAAKKADNYLVREAEKNLLAASDDLAYYCYLSR